MLDAHCEESSTDDIDNVNNDNFVIFVGDNIVIGRSNLRKENTSSPRKVSIITSFFSDTFNYISDPLHFIIYVITFKCYFSVHYLFLYLLSN